MKRWTGQISALSKLFWGLQTFFCFFIICTGFNFVVCPIFSSACVWVFCELCEHPLLFFCWLFFPFWCILENERLSKGLPFSWPLSPVFAVYFVPNHWIHSPIMSDSIDLCSAAVLSPSTPSDPSPCSCPLVELLLLWLCLARPSFLQSCLLSSFCGRVSCHALIGATGNLWMCSTAW